MSYREVTGNHCKNILDIHLIELVKQKLQILLTKCVYWAIRA